MTDPKEIIRIQSYLREAARSNYQSVPLPPFTLFFHPTDALQYFNYAIPDEPCSGDLAEALAQLREEFRRRGRIPRFEFFEAFAPELPAELGANSFLEEARQWSMLCTPDMLQPVPPIAGIQIVPIGKDSPDEDLLDFLLTQRQGFDPQNETAPAQKDIDEYRQWVGKSQFHEFLARLDGQPAGVAAFGQPINGVTEVAGIATRVAFRRKGIATLLTAHATRAAFDLGAHTACLTAADENAGQVYQAVGFQPFSTMLAYIDDDAAQPAS